MPSTPAIFSPARAQSRQETLLIISESGPNNLDIHGVGTIVPGYETSWNCYDRLISHDKKTLADGTEYYDRDKFVPELAEEWNVGDTSITFKLRKDAIFQDGTPVTASDVKWSFDRAVTATHPAFFTANGLRSGPLAALNQDGTVNSADNPASPGSIVSIFATGLGRMTPAAIDGAVPQAPLLRSPP